MPGISNGAWLELQEKLRTLESKTARLESRVETLKSKVIDLQGEASSFRRTVDNVHTLTYDIEQAFNFIADKLGVAQFMIYVRRSKK